MKFSNYLKIGLLSIVVICFLDSCKKTYEPPPVNADTLTATHTIAQLKARHTTSGNYVSINDSVIISGVVIANDKSGALYKQIFIRDNTGGICILLGDNGLYTSYPIGKRIFVKCKGLALSDYNNLIQLGYRNVSNGTVTLDDIPGPLITNFVTGGSLNNDASPKVVTASDLQAGSNPMQHPLVGDLITLKDYEFFASDLLRSLGDTSNAKSALLSQTKIKNCSSPQSIIVQTSGYANFASYAPPKGNGDITCIFTLYRTTPQLVVRDYSDFKMNGPRCFLFEEDFQAYNKDLNNCADQGGWKSYKEVGDICFVFNKLTSGSTFPQASAFNSTLYTGSALNSDIKCWLVSPQIDLPAGTTPKYLYDITERYSQGTITVKIINANNYNGNNTPWNSTWTDLNTILSTSSSFTNKSYSADISGYAGNKIYLAFQYNAPLGSIKNNVATYQPDNIKISKN